MLEDYVPVQTFYPRGILLPVTTTHGASLYLSHVPWWLTSTVAIPVLVHAAADFRSPLLICCGWPEPWGGFGTLPADS